MYSGRFSSIVPQKLRDVFAPLCCVIINMAFFALYKYIMFKVFAHFLPFLRDYLLNFEKESVIFRLLNNLKSRQEVFLSKYIF